MAEGINAIFVPKKLFSPAVIEETIPQVAEMGFNFGDTLLEEVVSKMKEWTSKSSVFDGVVLQQKGHISIWPKRKRVSLSSLVRDSDIKEIHKVDITFISQDDILWLQL